MCDTFVIMNDSTQDGSVIFGKNSDREPNEAHEVVIIPAADHSTDSRVKCTYIEIPQVSHTHAVLLAKPFWIWGAEMGANEYGVVIGNEAIFSRLPAGQEPGLIGMDYLRLALERAKTAQEALHCITGLLQTYGQSGNCGLAHPFFYHNSYILADPNDAWVLETIGNQWAAEHVTSGVRSISNAITIGKQWDLCSNDLVSFALKQGWCKNIAQFDFGQCYSDSIYTRFSDAKKRQACTTALLSAQKGRIGPSTAMKILRSHGNTEAHDWRPDTAIMGADVCSHAGFGPIRVSQTTGSMVSVLKNGEEAIHWITATAAPCTSIFKPVWMSAGVPVTGKSPTAEYDPATLWWKHERLHRTVIMNYPHLMPLFCQDRDQLEESFIQNLQESAPRQYSQLCFEQASLAEDEWTQRLQKITTPPAARFYFRNAWQGFNHKAKMP